MKLQWQVGLACRIEALGLLYDALSVNSSDESIDLGVCRLRGANPFQTILDTLV